MPRNVGVVIVAGGRGLRAGGDTPKQFQTIAGVPMVLRALRPFVSHPRVLHLVVVLTPEYCESPPWWLKEVMGEGMSLVAGGKERMDSVENGLAALPVECRLVLVHDAARPFVRREVIDAVLARVEAGDGAIAAEPVADTLKREGPHGIIVETVPREGLWRAHTPQGFPRSMLEEAYQWARREGIPGTDEASLVERAGHRVFLVPDAGTNFKVTTTEDLELAERIAAGLT